MGKLGELAERGLQKLRQNRKFLRGSHQHKRQQGDQSTFDGGEGVSTSMKRRMASLGWIRRSLVDEMPLSLAEVSRHGLCLVILPPIYGGCQCVL